MSDGHHQTAVYLEDTYLTAITGHVAATGGTADSAAWVAVRENIFHPQGGGQPADRGWLGECEVAPARDAETGLVVLHPRDDQGRTLGDLAEGDVVAARVDADLRLLHAALHTAGHLIEAAGRAQGWVLAGSIHFPGQARIEFTPGETAASLAGPEDREKAADRLRTRVASAIADDLPVTAEQDDEGRRVVRLGDLHAAPCGGTHVRSLADLADVTITAVKMKKGRVRVSYTASHRPLK
ncbi:alanyl-tRNA synthetase [Actinoallomurus vinaceus]|uniref:Alanyl-tRNA synthetase n=1 Tax=Actinoallomurus vinaceus TaxID=1080074 RepID=A0ABP8ULE8_9ACTN